MIGDYPKTPMEIIDTTRISRVFFNWMENYIASQWTVTTVGSGSVAAQDAIHGELKLTNSAADNDSLAMQLDKETLKFTKGKESFFKMRFKVNDATESFFMMGIYILDTTPNDASDGVFFSKADGVATLFGKVRKNSTTSTTAISLHTMVDDTFVEIAFLYDGQSAVIFYVNGVRKATLSNDNLPDDEELTLGFIIENGEAVIKSMNIDYVEAGQER